MSMLNLIKSIWQSSFKGKYFWKNYLVIVILTALIATGMTYSNSLLANDAEWTSLWEEPLWKILLLFFVGFSQLHNIKTKFNHLIWYNVKDMSQFFIYFILQILFYTFVYFISLLIILQVDALAFSQGIISFDLKTLGVFFSFFYTSLLVSAVVWLFPSVWAVIVSFFIIAPNPLFIYAMKKLKIDISILPCDYISKLSHSTTWEWHDILILCFYLIIFQYVIIHRYKHIWKQS